MLRNPLFSLALLLASALCATSAFAQSGTRGGFSSPAASSTAFPSGSYPSSQPVGGYYQGSNVRSLSSGAYAQGQTCANGSCAARSTASPVVSSASPTMNHSTNSVAQYPVVVGSSMTGLTQPVYNAYYYPAQSSAPYSPYTVHYGSTQAYSSTPINSCTVSVMSRSCR